MNIARTICLVRNQSLKRRCFRKLSLTARNFESTTASQPQVQEEKFDFEDLKVLERTERRKEKIPPFMKNVFVSVFNRDLLAYPEILNKEESEALEERLEALNSVFSDPKKTRDDRVDALKRTKMFAAPAGLTNNGLAINITESLRYLEVISSDMELGQQISDHWVGLEALKTGLDSDQYNKIIDDLITGERTIGLCIKEKVAERIAQADFRTKAEMDGQGVWRITGEKICALQSGYYLVLSTAEAGQFKAFLVHPDAEGVTVDDVFVSFFKTPAIPLNMGSQEQMSQKLGISRLHAATLTRCSLNNLLYSCAHYVKGRAFSGKPLSEMPTIRSKIGDMVLHIYASESAEYFTAGLIDGYTDPDVELEMAMCRNYTAIHSLPLALNLLSIYATEQPKETAERLDEVRTLLLNGETLDTVNMFIALNGIHHAGKMMADEIKQIRNPLFHPTFILRKVLKNRHQEKDDPKLTLFLAEHLHPSLQPGAKQLEYSVLRMQFACETLLSRHGVKIASATTELSRLAEAATEILVMTAVAARASRAYCIGLRNAEMEMKLAACFIENTRERVRKLIKDIDDGEFLNLDHFKLQFGKKTLDANATIIEKPTARVFW